MVVCWLTECIAPRQSWRDRRPLASSNKTWLICFRSHQATQSMGHQTCSRALHFPFLKLRMHTRILPNHGTTLLRSKAGSLCCCSLPMSSTKGTFLCLIQWWGERHVQTKKQTKSYEEGARQGTSSCLFDLRARITCTVKCRRDASKSWRYGDGAHDAIHSAGLLWCRMF